MYLLDTDHVVILQTRPRGDFERLVDRMNQHPAADFYLPIVAFHEQMLGWNAYISRAKDSKGVVRGYGNLEGELEEDDYDIDEEHLKEMEDRRREQRLDAAGRRPDTDKSAPDDRIAVAEILRSKSRAVILGDPGGGKTTLMRWFATAFLLRLKDDPNLNELPDVATLPDTAWTPILVRCRDLPHDAHRCDMDEILTQAVRTSEVPSQLRGALIAALRQQLESGAALLMVDGLDEIQDPMLRARFCRRLEALAVIYDKASMLVTSRIVGYREMRFRMGRSFRHATISDLTPDEMNEFAHRWTETTESQKTKTQQDETAAKLITDIHSSDRVARLARNPMLLTTLALVHRKIGRLPQRRVDLYREAVQVLLNWRREIDEPLDWLEAVPQLEYIAHAMCSRGVRVLNIKKPDMELLVVDEHMAIDPHDTIGRNQTVPIAEKLEITEEEVEKLYERLAPVFKLNLGWKKG